MTSHTTLIQGCVHTCRCPTMAVPSRIHKFHQISRACSKMADSDCCPKPHLYHRCTTMQRPYNDYVTTRKWSPGRSFQSSKLQYKQGLGMKWSCRLDERSSGKSTTQGFVAIQLDSSHMLPHNAHYPRTKWVPVWSQSLRRCRFMSNTHGRVKITQPTTTDKMSPSFRSKFWCARGAKRVRAPPLQESTEPSLAFSR